MPLFDYEVDDEGNVKITLTGNQVRDALKSVAQSLKTMAIDQLLDGGAREARKIAKVAKEMEELGQRIELEALLKSKDK